MPTVTIPYKPRTLQREIHGNLKRFNVLVCHRRFGKTVLAINELIKGALTCKKQSPRFAYVAPYYTQAKTIAWDYLRFFTKDIPGVKYNIAELRCILPNDGQIRLFGADNPDRLRGIYLDGVVGDEVAQHPPKVWTEVILPATVDRLGWVIYIGTPKGQNMLYDLYMKAQDSAEWHAALFKASETGIVPQVELDRLRAMMAEEEYNQEFECSFQAAIAGAYYGKEMSRALDEGRIGNVPYDPSLPVTTAWDLGIGDDTVIWFIQHSGRERRIIDYYATSGVGLDHYAKVLSEKPYVYDQHLAPHDIENKELGTGKTRKDVAASLGINFTTVQKLSIDDGINAVRMALPQCWFDKTKCADGIKALQQYQREWNDKMGTFRASPRHDWASHAADAFRYYAIGYNGQQSSYSYDELYS